MTNDVVVNELKELTKNEDVDLDRAEKEKIRGIVNGFTKEQKVEAIKSLPDELVINHFLEKFKIYKDFCIDAVERVNKLEREIGDYK